VDAEEKKRKDAQLQYKNKQGIMSRNRNKKKLVPVLGSGGLVFGQSID